MGEIGGTVGTAISAAFLFLIALINVIFLVQAVKARNRLQHTGARLGEEEARPIQGGGLMVRIIGPVLKAVDRPWKLYPVGLLFGLGELWCLDIVFELTSSGFDTASSIALLAISALAQKGPNGQSLNHARIIILPVSVSHPNVGESSRLISSSSLLPGCHLSILSIPS